LRYNGVNHRGHRQDAQRGLARHHDVLPSWSRCTRESPALADVRSGAKTRELYEPDEREATEPQSVRVLWSKLLSSASMPARPRLRGGGRSAHLYQLAGICASALDCKRGKLLPGSHPGSITTVRLSAAQNSDLGRRGGAATPFRGKQSRAALAPAARRPRPPRTGSRPRSAERDRGSARAPTFFANQRHASFRYPRLRIRPCRRVRRCAACPASALPSASQSPRQRALVCAASAT
jgi:hypothetical protein